MSITILRNGIYFDGLGNKGVKKDVVIKDNIIAEVSDMALPIDGAREIDVTGKWVCPGFLDIHAHYDAELEVMPALDESVRHGVTTVIIGNCSLSAAVGKDEDIVDLFCRVENIPAKALSDWLIGNIKWTSPKEYYAHLDTVPVGPNIASFIGHSNIRMAAMGVERSFTEKKANKEEILKMQDLVEEALQEGYLGVSIDMLPFHRWAGVYNKKFTGVSVPSQQAAKSEYYKLADVLRKYNRVLQITPNAIDKTSFVTIMNLSRGGVFKKSIRTTIVAALDLKSNERIYKLLKLLGFLGNDILGAKMRFQTLAEPFKNFGDGPITPLFEEFPSMIKAISATGEERKQIFKDKTFRKQFEKEWNHKATSVFPRALKEMWVVKSPDASHIGKNFIQIAQEANKEAVGHFMDLLAEYDTQIRWWCDTSNHREKVRLELLGYKHCMPGFNDSGAHNVNMAFHDGPLQFLKTALRYPEEMSIEKAIYRSTKEPADFLGIDAGDISVGKRADVVVIDPSRIEAEINSDPIEDYHPAFGGGYRLVKRSGKVVQHVFINGNEAYTNNGVLKFHEDLGKKKIFGQLLRSNLGKS
ncbi:MAG: amidohydrolase family protein [Chitinophagales bacterium]|nr:amidohydrolase family protein [Chitinophagales bacterium]MCZ2394767.1 amidohydrolase family protein [Chitinophagales bacterium]